MILVLSQKDDADQLGRWLTAQFANCRANDAGKANQAGDIHSGCGGRRSLSSERSMPSERRVFAYSI